MFWFRKLGFRAMRINFNQNCPVAVVFTSKCISPIGKIKRKWIINELFGISDHLKKKSAHLFRCPWANERWIFQINNVSFFLLSRKFWLKWKWVSIFGQQFHPKRLYFRPHRVCLVRFDFFSCSKIKRLTQTKNYCDLN